MLLSEIDPDCKDCGAALMQAGSPKLWLCPNGHGRLIGPATCDEMKAIRHTKDLIWIKRLPVATKIRSDKGACVGYRINGEDRKLAIDLVGPTYDETMNAGDGCIVVRFEREEPVMWEAVILRPRISRKKEEAPAP